MSLNRGTILVIKIVLRHFLKDRSTFNRPYWGSNANGPEGPMMVARSRAERRIAEKGGIVLRISFMNRFFLVPGVCLDCLSTRICLDLNRETKAVCRQSLAYPR